jgi:hypothetical protein
VEEALDVEAVEDDLGVRAAALDHTDVGAGHVQDHQLYASAAVQAELIEELLESSDGSVGPLRSRPALRTRGS